MLMTVHIMVLQLNLKINSSLLQFESYFSVMYTVLNKVIADILGILGISKLLVFLR